MPGSPARFTGIVIKSDRYILRGSSTFSPALKAVVGDVGVSKVSAVGEVYNLERAEYFPGTFSAAEAGITIGGGAGAQIMENQYGALMKLTSTKQGVQLKLAPEGLKVQFK